MTELEAMKAQRDQAEAQADRLNKANAEKWDAIAKAVALLRPLVAQPDGGEVDALRRELAQRDALIADEAFGDRDNASLRTQLRAALAKSEQRREALLAVQESKCAEGVVAAYDDGDQGLSNLIRAALSPDAPSAPTKEPAADTKAISAVLYRSPPEVLPYVTTLIQERDTLAAELREKCAEIARLRAEKPELHSALETIDSLRAELREAMASRAKVVEERDSANKREDEFRRDVVRLMDDDAKLREALQGAVRLHFDGHRDWTPDWMLAARALGVTPGAKP